MEEGGTNQRQDLEQWFPIINFNTQFHISISCVYTIYTYICHIDIYIHNYLRERASVV